MDANRYHELCSRSATLARPVLDDTRRLLAAEAPELARYVAAILEGPAIPKPPEHVGGPETDQFDAMLPAEVLEEIVDFLGCREADAAMTVDGRSVGELVDLWNRQRLE